MRKKILLLAAMVVASSTTIDAQRKFPFFWKKKKAKTEQTTPAKKESEYDVLDAFLQKLPFVLNPGGKAAVLTFHSGEDRMVKKAFRAGRGIYYKEVSKDVIRPSARECRENGRARSTKMRWAVAMGGKE